MKKTEKIDRQISAKQTHTKRQIGRELEKGESEH